MYFQGIKSMKFCIWLAALMFLFRVSWSQDSLKVYSAVRIDQSPKIDGILNEAIWQQAVPMNQFYQYQPIEGSVPDHPTDVRITYDNSAIYIGAILYDSSPDSIMGELGARDAQ